MASEECSFKLAQVSLHAPAQAQKTAATAATTTSHDNEDDDDGTLHNGNHGFC